LKQNSEIFETYEFYYNLKINENSILNPGQGLQVLFLETRGALYEICPAKGYWPLVAVDPEIDGGD
jgi:hypothetical protein